MASDTKSGHIRMLALSVSSHAVHSDHALFAAVDTSNDHFMMPTSRLSNHAVFAACRAAAYLKLGNAEAALKDAEVATELDPDYAKAYLRRGSAHQALEHFEDAVRDFEKVCKWRCCEKQ